MAAAPTLAHPPPPAGLTQVHGRISFCVFGSAARAGPFFVFFQPERRRTSGGKRVVMAVEIVDVGPCKKLLKVSVDREQVQRKLEKSYSDLRGAVSIKGFRKGRVPQKILEKRYGKSVEQDVQQSLLHETFEALIEEHDLDVLGEPSFEKEPTFAMGEDPAFTYEATVLVRPEFELPDLKELRVERPPIAVDEAELERQLEGMRRIRASSEPKGDDAVCERGDALVAKIEYLVDGAVQRTIESATVWTGDERFGPIELEDLGGKLEGAKVGDKVDVPCTFPPDLGMPEGEQALRLEVGALRTYDVPELDEAFAKDLGFDSLEDMRDAVRSQLLKREENRAEAIANERILDAVLEKLDFPLPDDLIDRQLDDLALRAMIMARQSGKGDDEAKEAGGQVRSANRDEVVRRLKAQFVLDKIARDRKIFATEDDMAAALQEMAQQQGRPIDDVVEELQKSDLLGRLRQEVRLDKVRKYLREKVEVIDEENR